MKNQHLTFNFDQPFTSENLNKILYNLFNPGVLNISYSFNGNSITINELSFLIKPINKDDILLQVNTTKTFTKSKEFTYDDLFIARYQFENNNILGVEFRYINSNNKLPNDIIILSLILDLNGKIIDIDNSKQSRANINLIDVNTIFPLTKYLDGYFVGNNSNQIPIANDNMNEDLNVEFIENNSIDKYIVSKKSEIVQFPNSFDIQDYSMIETLPMDYLDGNEIDLAIHVISEYINGKKIQPQDLSLPDEESQIPIANNILQRNLNAQMLSGLLSSNISQREHSHDLKKIEDGLVYKKVKYLENQLISNKSIEEDGISFNKIDNIAYDTYSKQNFTPIYETGYFTLSGDTFKNILFSRYIKNAKIFLQKIGEVDVEEKEKRSAYIYDITESGFYVNQFSGIKLNGNDYIRYDADVNINTYHYFVIGEKYEI